MLTGALVLAAYLAVLGLLAWSVRRLRLKVFLGLVVTASFMLVSWQLVSPEAIAAALGLADASDPPANKLPAEAVKRVEVVEKALNDPGSELRKLHRVAVQTFVSKADFGRSRIPLQEELVQREPKMWSLEDLMNETTKVDAKELERIHLISMMSFSISVPVVKAAKVNAVKGQHVVQNFKLASDLRLDSLGLVGLLLNDNPVVYTSPETRMQNLSKAAKRPTDFVEDAGLEQLRKGEDFCREKDGEVRMLGAIRATDQCTKCHDAARGDLLGAFSYTLTKVAKKPGR